MVVSDSQGTPTPLPAMGKHSSDPPSTLKRFSSPQNVMEDSVEAALLYPNPNANATAAIKVSSFNPISDDSSSSSSNSSGSEITDQGDKASIKIVKFEKEGHASHTP